MSYDFKELKDSLREAEEWLVREFGGIRTGRAAPALLDSVIVEAYGAKMSLRDLASTTTEDARTLCVAPYDVSTVRAIERAIRAANLGVSVIADERGVRVAFPELTAERRTLLMKLSRGKLEEARIRSRSARDSAWSDIQKRERDGEMGEDDKFRAKEEMEKLVQEGNRALEACFGKKEREIGT
ncbi:MAG: ribosome-recycling factor [bacterium]|nr:ribosome-recycling factor [bacterium]MDZ4284591.1 ribosome-recycling factor [Patescibacteria group bacterium]